MEGSHSGLVRRTRNALEEQSSRRFKSCTLRQNSEYTMFLNFTKKSPIIKIAKDTMPAVVSILISENFKKTFKKSDNLNEIEISNGSGFIVDESGIVLTNRHILSNQPADYSIITNDGEKLKAKIIARDPINDIAILKIADLQEKNIKFPIIKLGNSSKVELGENVIAFGNALGIFKNTVSAGIVSGLGRHISAKINLRTEAQKMRGLIQTDAAINPGNSGGPLVDMDGRAVGINAAIVYGAQNMGFSIPINVVHRDLDDLRKFGRVRRPLLGLRYVTIDENVGEKLDLAVSYGALVVGSNGESSVIPHSPAALAGLRDKDIILECNGEKITKEKTIQDFLENCAVGDALDLRIRRGVKEMSVKVVLTERK